MGGCWRQENHYRYARIHFDLDSHDWGYRPLAGDYRAVDDDPNRTVRNLGKKPATSGSKRQGAHYIPPAPSATANCWPRPPRRQTPPLC